MTAMREKEILMCHVNIIFAKSSMIDASRDNSIVSNHPSINDDRAQVRVGGN